MFVIIAPKVPHFIGVAVGQGVGCDSQGVEAEEGDPSFPEVFVGAMPSSTSGFEKCTSAGVSSPGALSYRTNRTSQTGRTARITLGVYLGEIYLPACRSRRGVVYRSEVQLARVGEFFYRY